MMRTKWYTPCYKRCVEDRPSCPMCRAVTIVIHDVLGRRYNVLKSVTVFVTGVMIISISFNFLCFLNSSRGDE